MPMNTAHMHNVSTELAARPINLSQPVTVEAMFSSPDVPASSASFCASAGSFKVSLNSPTSAAKATMPRVRAGSFSQDQLRVMRILVALLRVDERRNCLHDVT